MLHWISVGLFTDNEHVNTEARIPFYIDVFSSAQCIEAGQDSIAGHLDIIHWGKKQKKQIEKQPKFCLVPP